MEELTWEKALAWILYSAWARTRCCHGEAYLQAAQDLLCVVYGGEFCKRRVMLQF